MRITTLAVGHLGTNCYLVESKNEVGIIDPGDDGEYIIDIIQRKELNPVWAIATHGHFDHVLAAMEIALTFKIPFYIHAKDEFLLKDAHRSANFFTGTEVEPFVIKADYMEEKDVLKVGDVQFEVIETPGHTPGLVCLYSKTEKVLFCGDLVFAGGGVGRTDFKYSSEKDLWHSIKKISKLPKDTIVYPGHGEKLKINDINFP